MHTKINLLVAATLLLAGCDKSAPAPATPPDEQVVEPEPEPEPEPEAGDSEGEVAAGEEGGEPEPEPEPEPPPKDSFTVATFNVQWAHDTLVDGKETKRIASNRAQTDEDWEWKYTAIAEVIAAAKPDIIALHEVGGYLEASDIIGVIEEKGGPGYSLSFVEGEDTMTGHGSAILSVFPVTDERRFDISMRRQLVVDVELPDGSAATIVAMHPPEGAFKKPAASRRDQVEALLRETKKIRAKQPVIFLATMGSEITPADDDYASSAGGMIAGVATKKDDDDCDDSAGEPLVVQTTVDEKLADRVFSCGLAMRDAEAFGQDLIVREDPDDTSKAWHEVPVDKAPHRDVSNHLLVMAEIELPKPAPEGEGEGEASE